MLRQFLRNTQLKRRVRQQYRRDLCDCVGIGFAWAGGGVRGHIEAIQRYSTHRVKLFPETDLAIWASENGCREQLMCQLRGVPMAAFKVLHSHVDPSFIRICQRASKDGVPWVHTYHTLYFPEDWGGRLAPWQEEINDALINTARHADIRISISPWLQKLLREEHGIETQVIPNGVDTQMCSTVVDLSHYPNLGKLKDYVLFSGNLSEVKNPLMFIELAELWPELQFVMIGADLTLDRLSSHFPRPIPNNLIPMGPVNHRLSLSFTKSARALVVTSLSEGLPTAVMEAMALERRVVVPDSFGCADLVDHLETGFLFEPESLEDLSAKFELALRSEDTGGNAKREIEQHYGWDVVSRQLDEVYSYALNAKGCAAK